MPATSKSIINVGDALENLYSLTPDQQAAILESLAATGTPIGEEGAIVMYTGNQVYKLLLMEYSEFNFFSSSLFWSGTTEALAGRWVDYMATAGDNWANAYKALMLTEYDPLHNYDGTETESITETHTGTDTDTRTPNLTTTQTPNLTDTSGLYGVNSSAAVNREEQTHTGTDTTTTTGTDTTQKEYDTEHETVRELVKGGNLGVTSSQQMISQELELRKKNLLLSIVREFAYYNFFIC